MTRLLRLPLLFAALGPSLGLACDCSAILNETTADVVFEGMAEKSIQWKEVGAAGMYAFARHGFVASVVLKGPDRSFFYVDTSVTDCGYPFEAGKRYRVYAQLYKKSGIEWLAGICSKTTPLEQRK